jgi:competence protein ComEC
MAKRRTKAKRNTLLELIIAIIFIIVAYVGYDNLDILEINEVSNANILTEETSNIILANENEVSNTNTISAEKTENVTLTGDKIQIHFFDVGQADSILLISNNETMLIDAGTNEKGQTVVENIKNLGITKIDYLIGTHPHEDHIGGLDDVINNFEIGTIYMPKVQTNTKTFEDVLDAISNKGLKITTPEKGDKFNVGNVECEIMLCDSELSEKENNLNLSSIVIRAVYNKQSYLFMGDAETKNEQTRDWPQTNVLKVGHHGSNTSSSQSFLNQVMPQIAIIQVGKDNSYGHPKQAILNRIQKLGTTIYRTDEKGNILLESDGIDNKISFY